MPRGDNVNKVKEPVPPVKTDEIHASLLELKQGLEQLYQQHGKQLFLDSSQGRVTQMLHDLNKEVDLLADTVGRYQQACADESASLLLQTLAYPPSHMLEGKGDPWVRWYAWVPVKLTVSKESRWLQWIEVRKFRAAPWFLDGNRWWWEYRDIKTAVPSK